MDGWRGEKGWGCRDRGIRRIGLIGMRIGMYIVGDGGIEG